MTEDDQITCAKFDFDRDHIAAMRRIVAKMAAPKNTRARLANYERARIPSEVIAEWDSHVLVADIGRRKQRRAGQVSA